MQQRRLRLGDILDDYCPRERRVTNHVIVAMVDDDVKQTRCSTCDADHEYKQAKVPPGRKKKEAGVLSAEAADVPRARRVDQDDVPELPDLSEASGDDLTADVVAVAGPVSSGADVERYAAPESPVQADDAEPPVIERDDDGPVHRRLIRATFPRPEGQPPEWKEPEFTVRQPGGRGGREVDGNRGPGAGKRRNRPQRAGGAFRPDGRFGGGFSGNGPQGQGPRGAGQGRRGGPSPGNQGGNGAGHNRGGRPGGPEGGSRRRRGR